MSINLYEGPVPHALGNAEEDRPDLTPYLVEGGGPKTAVVVCPGGGYEYHADHEGEPIARWLNRIGISAFVLKYRVRPYRHPVPLSDAQRAIRLVRSRAEEWNVNRAAIGTLGFSAGGHLASAAGTRFDAGRPDADDPVERESCRPDFQVLCYPVITFAHPFRHQGSMDNLLGKDAPEALGLACSSERQVTLDTPPAFIWHTFDDPVVDIENSFLFATAMRRNGAPVEFHGYESGKHGLGLAEESPYARSWTQACERWLKRRS